MILAKMAVRSEDSKIERPPGRSTVDASNRPVIDRSLWPIATNAIGLFSEVDPNKQESAFAVLITYTLA